MAGSWQWVAEGVGVTTSRRELTTSTVIVSGASALLVDPSWAPDELDWIATSLAAEGLTVSAGFSTHAHHDHLLWHPGLGDGPRWASPETARAAAERRQEFVTALGPWPDGLAGLVGRLQAVHGDRVPWPGPEVRLIVHDAHTAGHTALWVPHTRVLLAGDMLSDVELPLPEQTGLAEYAAGLDALHACASTAQVVVPGHGHPGSVGEPLRRWRADHDYIHALLAGDDPDDPRRALPGMAEVHRANLTLARHR
jgi:glyoxylase-like metal-dependent hydrolase (beta-lactamase superfamily II)